MSSHMRCGQTSTIHSLIPHGKPSKSSESLAKQRNKLSKTLSAFRICLAWAWPLSSGWSSEYCSRVPLTRFYAARCEDEKTSGQGISATFCHPPSKKPPSPTPGRCGKTTINAHAKGCGAFVLTLTSLKPGSRAPDWPECWFRITRGNRTCLQLLLVRLTRTL